MYFPTTSILLSGLSLASAAAILKPRAIDAQTPPAGFQLALAQNTTETSNLSIATLLSGEKGVEILLSAGANTFAPGATCTISLNKPSSIIGVGMAKVTQIASASTQDNLVVANDLAGGFSGTMTFSDITNNVVFNPAQLACAQFTTLRITPIVQKNASVSWVQNDSTNTGLTLNIVAAAP